MNQIPDGLERELAPRDGRWCRMQARRDDRNPQHGAATIIDMGVSVSMPQATHRNQRKAPSVEWMGRIRDRDLFGRTWVSRSGIVNSLAVPEQGIAQGADLEQLVPVAARASKAGHLHAEHDADMAQADLSHEALEAQASLG